MGVLALGFAAVVGYALLTVVPAGERRAAAKPRPAAAEPADHIDRASREAMRDILREADERESP